MDLNTATNTLTSLSADTLLIVGVVAVLFFYIWRRGAAKVNLFALSLPLAVLITTVCPFKTSIGSFFSSLSINAGIAPLSVFVVSVPVSMWLMGNIILDLTNKHRLKQAIIISVAIVILLLTIFYHFVSVEIIYNFGPGIDSLFGPKANAFWMAILSFFAIGFARKM